MTATPLVSLDELGKHKSSGTPAPARGRPTTGMDSLDKYAGPRRALVFIRALCFRLSLTWRSSGCATSPALHSSEARRKGPRACRPR